MHGDSSYLGSTNLGNVDDSTYHFPTGNLAMGTFLKSTSNCQFIPSGGSGSGAAADSYYGAVNDGGDVGTVQCDYGASAAEASCYKSYVDYPIDDANVREEMNQLFTIAWQDPVL